MQDVGRGGQTQTVWDRRKENKLDDKILYISKDRDRVLRKTILSVFKRMEMIVDGFEENIYKGLKWSGEDLKILSSVVDQMDKNEKITEANFPICKEIKDAVNSHGNENTGESAEHKENV
jgi:hypothetical protein